MSDPNTPSLDPNITATKKPYPAFNYNAPIDAELGVPNFYFQLIDITRPDFYFEVQLKSDDFLAKIGQSDDKVFHLWLPVDFDYKDFNYFLLLNKEFTKPTYLVTLETRPKILVQERGDFISIIFITKNEVRQQVVVDKVRMRVIYIKPLTLPGVTK